MDFPHEIPAWEVTSALWPARPSALPVEFQAGDRVAVHVLFRGRDQHGLYRQSELVWLVVREAGEGDCLLGTVEKSPTQSLALQVGDVVEFEPRQVSFFQLVSRRRSTKERPHLRAHFPLEATVAALKRVDPR